MVNTIKPDKIKLGFTLAFCLALIIYLVRFAAANQEWFTEYAKNGLEFAKDSWSCSPTIQEISSLPDDAIIISNAPGVIELMTQYSSYFYPSEYNPGSQQNAKSPEEQFLHLQTFLNSHSSIYVVHFIDIGRSYLVSEENMIEKLNLELIVNLKDGRIYRTSNH